MSTPARVSSHEVTEFEFHMSPLASSWRPQTAVGTEWVASSSRRARSASAITRTGLSTAAAASGIDPPRQHRTS